MPPQPATEHTLLAVTHEPWAEPLRRPAMGNELDRHTRIALTNRYVEYAGRPAIPVSGELHFSRVPRAEWAERLRLMRSGGVTAVAAYVIWNHHEPVQGAPSFDGNLDVAAFIREAASAGLDVVLRIGPWAHGEARNGGFPDWVQQAPVAHRTDDPAYLALVEPWFAALGTQVAGLCGPDSPVIAIQLDNELYDQPGHLVTLKAMARRHGLVAPIYTATAWGGAELPDGEVLPLYGGYGDGFWVDADHAWDTTFREHFFFSHTWDDPGIGADLRDHPGIGRRPETPRLPSASFPAATCELGGGMATAYHRRPLLSGADIAAVAHNKIGNGSGWQGYYMYGGGSNPRPGLQESHATGYPNDLPEFDYDFHAPIGAAGRLSAAHAALRRQHAFLAAFGDRLAPMPSTLPRHHPTDVDDTTTLRWAIRSDGASGWLFITWQQPHVPLDPVPGAQFEVRIGDRTRVLPHTPVDVPVGTIAHWPIALEVGGVTLDWATASPLTVLDGAVPTLVLVAEAGIPVELATDAAIVAAFTAAMPTDAPTRAPADAATIRPASDGAFVSIPELGVCSLDVADARVVRLAEGDARLDVLVLPADTADRLWVLDASGRRRLVLSPDAVFEDGHGRIAVRTPGVAEVVEYVAADERFTRVAVASDDAASAGITNLPLGDSITADAPLPASFGTFHGRASAPSRDELARSATSWTLRLPPATAARRYLEIDWAGDVARLEVDGEVVADRFWDGTTWTIGLDALGLDGAGTDGAELTLRILPLHPDAAVHLPAAASIRRGASDGPLLALDAVTLVSAPLWTEATDTAP